MEQYRPKLIKFCQEYDIELMVLFGSFATDNCKKNSDIDLAIKTNNITLINNNKLKLLNELSQILDYKEIDLILINYADPLLKFNIAREGKLIYEKKEDLFDIFKVRAIGENNDARKFYKLEKIFIENYLAGRNTNDKHRVSPPKVK